MFQLIQQECLRHQVHMQAILAFHTAKTIDFAEDTLVYGVSSYSSYESFEKGDIVKVFKSCAPTYTRANCHLWNGEISTELSCYSGGRTSKTAGRGDLVQLYFYLTEQDFLSLSSLLKGL